MSDIKKYLEILRDILVGFEQGYHIAPSKERIDACKMIIKALEQEPTTKNVLAIDCIVDVLGSYTDLDIPYKREIAENILIKLPSITPQEPTDNDVVLTYDMYHDLIADRAEKLEQEFILDKLRAEITTLQNRCYALTKGTMCAFCKYECEYKVEIEE